MATCAFCLAHPGKFYRMRQLLPGTKRAGQIRAGRDFPSPAKNDA
jgi:hypothetical protein